MPGTPIFTDAEVAAWDKKTKDAMNHVAGDKVYRPEGPNPYNESGCRRRDAVGRAFRVEQLRRMRARPDDILNLILVAFHEKGTDTLTWEDVFVHGLPDRISKADTPETRKHVHTVLDALHHMPLSWGMSAALRFFRGTGKQGKPPWSDKVGAGVLGKNYGWKQFEADWFMHLFYGWPLTDLFLKDDSPDCYGEEAHEIEEEGGNRWAATHKERDDDFIDSLMELLKGRGLAEAIIQPDIPKPKPRKVKVFKPGDRITTRTVRDLPAGSHFRWIHLERAYRGEDRVTEHFTYDGVYLSKMGHGDYAVRPVMESTAFEAQECSGSRVFAQAEYLGPWEGPVLEVEAAQWKTSKRKKTTNGWDDKAIW
jgi:hypothetical protein